MATAKTMIPKPERIILIVLDTLRSDHMSCNGYRRNTTPNLDSFSQECVNFKYAFATCSYTVPSHTSMFTGKYPHRHSVGFSNGPPTKSLDNDLFMTEILSDVGYETGAFISSMVLGRENGGCLMPGFKTYDDYMTSVELNRPSLSVRSGKQTTSVALQWLDNIEGKNLFLFLHYFDIHGPYVNEPPYDSLFIGDHLYGPPAFLEKVPDERAYAGIPSYQVLRQKRRDDGELIDYEKDVNFYCAQYDSGIRYVDDCLSSLLVELKKRGMYDDALIIVTSDHGEALGENNVWFFHGLTVTLDQVHVPLMIKPHASSGLDSSAVYEQVSLADIFPTICQIIGFDCDHMDLDGQSLLSLMDPANVRDSNILSRKVISEIECQVAHIDTINMQIVPRGVDVENLKYYYLEHLSTLEASCPYRFPEAKSIHTSHRDFIPLIAYDIAKFSQFYRYQFAAQFTENCKVLNLFCGDFAGPQMLSLKSKEVTGLSFDDALSAYARKACNNSNLNFINKTLDEVWFNDNELFDVIICFLEFNSLEQVYKLFPHINRLLKKEGTAIFSMPNTRNGVGGLYSWDSCYFEEFSFSDLHEMFVGNFTYLYWYRQEVCPSFRITSIPSSLDKCLGQRFIEKEFVQRPYVLDSIENVFSHFVVICSQTDIDVLSVTGEDLLSGHQYFIACADEYVHSLKLKGPKGDNKIQELDRTLHEVQAALKHIHDSDGWRLLTKYYRLRERVLPPSSMRRRIMKAIGKFLRK